MGISQGISTETNNKSTGLLLDWLWFLPQNTLSGMFSEFPGVFKAFSLALIPHFHIVAVQSHQRFCT